MKKIPWKGITAACLSLALLVVARCVVTVGKAQYYGQDWIAKVMEDPWFLVGILAAALGLGALAALAVQNKNISRIKE